MTQIDDDEVRRTPLSRERVLLAAIELADEHGIERVSMRRLASDLGVDPMSLYNHVANKEDLLDGMADLVVGEIDPVPPGEGWKAGLRAMAMAARETMMRHPWASAVIATRTEAAPSVMWRFEAVAGLLRSGGFSIELVHHALHLLGSRMLGFSQELFDESAALEEGPEVMALRAHQMRAQFPNLSDMMLKISHDESTVVGSGCDDLFEFTFAFDLILDGLDRLRNAAG
jgi:AcrR family transcriptional regulator